MGPLAATMTMNCSASYRLAIVNPNDELNSIQFTVIIGTDSVARRSPSVIFPLLVKYLGEDGENVPVAGAVAICSPWDLLIGSRFMARRPVQNLYARVLGIGLQSYARSNQSHFVRLADWEGIMKTPSIREFDKYATCVIEKFETVDAYYRWCSSAPYVKNVSVPLLCISSLDDPICTAEAIPWDECRTNKNIVLATTKHGGHLGFFEGRTASGMWWVRAVNEFIGVLHSSPCMHRQKKSALVSAIGNEPTTDNMVKKPPKGQIFQNRSSNDMVSDAAQFEHPKDLESACASASNIVKLSNAAACVDDVKSLGTTRRLLHNFSRQNRRSVWLVAYLACLFYLAIGSSLHFIFKNFKRLLPAKLHN